MKTLSIILLILNVICVVVNYYAGNYIIGCINALAIGTLFSSITKN